MRLRSPADAKPETSGTSALSSRRRVRMEELSNTGTLSSRSVTTPLVQSTPLSVSIHPSSSKARRGRKSVMPSSSSPVEAAGPSKADSSKPSPMKTRRLQKSRDSVPRCTLCKKVKGDLKACSKCNLNYHLRKCLLHSEEMSLVAEKKKKWLCPKCIRCSVCHLIIDDVYNRECCLCLRVWHGQCSKGKGHGSAHDWKCKQCSKADSKSPSKTPVVVKKSPASTSKSLPKTVVAATPASVGIVDQCAKRKRGRPRKIFPDQSASASTSTEMVLPVVQDDDTVNILASRAEVWDELMEYEKRTDAPFVRGQSRSKSRSPVKRPTTAPLRLATQEDTDMFLAAKRAFLEEQESRPPAQTRCTTEGKWVRVGSAEEMKALYDSPYPNDVRSAESVCVCPYCLYPTGDEDVYRIHQENCSFSHPPGNEIYRDENISFFEVDGTEQRTYCRNLCLLAKMFISSKTLHHEVDTFLFYVLTEICATGCRIVGYFSKEKNPSKNNNLSCLLTLPSERRQGYGRLLIDMSYQLSAIELKVGSPEHPLSDLGLFAYRGFWRASILCYLRSVRNVPHTSIKNMSLTTRIHPTDIVNQLIRDKLLIYKDGNYFVKTGKRAYKWPLSICRGRKVDSERLVWRPDYDTSQLDATKLNYYV